MIILKHLLKIIFSFSFVFTQIDSSYSVISIGNFAYWQRYDAKSAHTPSGGSGGIYPANKVGTIYLDGILVGGYTSGSTLHVSGSIYTNGMVSGYIDNGQLIQSEATRIYVIRPNLSDISDDEWRDEAKIIFNKSDSSFVDTINNSGIIEIDEYASWPSSATLVDGSTDSHLAPSLSQTGAIWDNREGAVNLPSYARDYDRFDYWGTDDVIINFGESSLSWEYYSGWLHTDSTEGSATFGEAVYQPFSMYRTTVTGDTFRLFVGFWDTNHDGKWSCNVEVVDGENVYDWLCPTYGSESFEPIYAIQGYDVDGNPVSYDPDKADEYIAYQLNPTADQAEFDALNLAANSAWGNAAGDFDYPFVTATLFGAYYGPNSDGSYTAGEAGDGGATALPQIGNYDKYGVELTVNHYFRFETSNDTSTYTFIDSSGIITQEDINNIQYQYLNNIQNWPTDLGAPFYDLDNDGIYEPEEGEYPGYADADQVIWYVVTDADFAATSSLYGTSPIGLEMQVTTFAYNTTNELRQSIFKRLLLINKGQEPLTDAYVSIWSDPDIGDYTNDFVGVDTTLNMMFAYNGDSSDADYANYYLPPAAVGYKIIHGPIIESEGDTAVVNFKTKLGFKNLPASSFGYFVAGGVYSDPGPYGDIEGAREYYNLMRGFAPTEFLDNPTAWIDSSSGTPVETKFPLAGNPVTGIGDLDSNPSDRRMLLNVGPFELSIGDTQEVLLSLTGGLSSDYLASIENLKYNKISSESFIKTLINSDFDVSTNNSITWYPGDTDHNGQVDADDIISIGMYFHELNDAATAPDSGSFVWSPRNSFSGLSINNFLMADVNSDGIIDERDVVGIGVHWGNTYSVGDESVSLWNNLDIYSLSDLQKIRFQKLYDSLTGQSEPVNEMRAVLKAILGIGLPSEFSLQQNYPNPFNSETTIKFSLPKPSIVNLSIYNLLGQIVDTPVKNNSYFPGKYVIQYNNDLLSSGVYILRIDTGAWSSTKKIMLLK